MSINKSRYINRTGRNRRMPTCLRGRRCDIHASRKGGIHPSLGSCRTPERHMPWIIRRRLALEAPWEQRSALASMMWRFTSNAGCVSSWGGGRECSTPLGSASATSEVKVGLRMRVGGGGSEFGTPHPFLRAVWRYAGATVLSYVTLAMVPPPSSCKRSHAPAACKPGCCQPSSPL